LRNAQAITRERRVLRNCLYTETKNMAYAVDALLGERSYPYNVAYTSRGWLYDLGYVYLYQWK